jgi:hypothetical protein
MFCGAGDDVDLWIEQQQVLIGYGFEFVDTDQKKGFLDPSIAGHF